MNPSTDKITLTAHASDTQALLNAAAAMGAPKRNPDPDGKHYAVVPEGYELVNLPEAEEPLRAKGTVKLRDVQSFIAFVSAHLLNRSTVYASLDPAKFLAVLDDFPAPQEPAWREFRAEFVLPASREWKIWSEGNRVARTQLGFAEFLQDNLPDVATPDGATLLEMALNFESSQTGHFVAAQRLQDGSHTLQWKAENNASGSVKLPAEIVLSIPVFENDEPRELAARLRYRVKEGSLQIWYELIRPHKVLEAAFREAWKRIEDSLGTTILLGSPE